MRELIETEPDDAGRARSSRKVHTERSTPVCLKTIHVNSRKNSRSVRQVSFKEQSRNTRTPRDSAAIQPRPFSSYEDPLGTWASHQLSPRPPPLQPPQLKVQLQTANSKSSKIVVKKPLHIIKSSTNRTSLNSQKGTIIRSL